VYLHGEAARAGQHALHLVGVDLLDLAELRRRQVELLFINAVWTLARAPGGILAMSSTF